MVIKISERKIRQIERLHYEDGLSMLRTARRAGVSYSTVYGVTRAKELGYSSWNDYLKSHVEARRFKSRVTYQRHLLKKKRMSDKEYREFLAHEKGYRSVSEREMDIAKKGGFKSVKEYNKHLANKRRHRLLNRLFSRLLKNRLSELEKSEIWLAHCIRTSPSMITSYKSGEDVPSFRMQERIFKALGLPYKTLDDLVS